MEVDMIADNVEKCVVDSEYSGSSGAFCSTNSESFGSPSELWRSSSSLESLQASEVSEASEASARNRVCVLCIRTHRTQRTHRTKTQDQDASAWCSCIRTPVLGARTSGRQCLVLVHQDALAVCARVWDATHCAPAPGTQHSPVADVPAPRMQHKCGSAPKTQYKCAPMPGTQHICLADAPSPGTQHVMDCSSQTL
ncbi:hypothetical protein BGX38DRAFT_1268963 [Terfezia claveryi]|nr:hypothetical protein BGX38DRAFT_1268963 [Terfezia claveryi]